LKHASQNAAWRCTLQKTKIVYCKDQRRTGSYPNVKFDFLGYEFRLRRVRNPRDAKVFLGFTPAVSPSSLKSMRDAIRELEIRRRTHMSMAGIAKQLNPLLRGWMTYYGCFTPSALAPFYRYVNQTLRGWAAHFTEDGQRFQTIVSMHFI
jgi:hypothetical protein